MRRALIHPSPPRPARLASQPPGAQNAKDPGALDTRTYQLRSRLAYTNYNVLGVSPEVMCTVPSNPPRLLPSSLSPCMSDV